MKNHGTENKYEETVARLVGTANELIEVVKKTIASIVSLDGTHKATDILKKILPRVDLAQRQ